MSHLVLTQASSDWPFEEKSRNVGSIGVFWPLAQLSRIEGLTVKLDLCAWGGPSNDKTNYTMNERGANCSCSAQL